MNHLDNFIADVEASGADQKLYTQAELDAAVQAAEPSAPLAKAKSLMTWLTDDERMEVISLFCRHCGSTDPSCQCWNDD